MSRRLPHRASDARPPDVHYARARGSPSLRIDVCCMLPLCSAALDRAESRRSPRRAMKCSKNGRLLRSTNTDMALPCTIKIITRLIFLKCATPNAEPKQQRCPRAERRPRKTTNTLGFVRRVPPPLQEADVLRLARDLVLEPLRVGLDVGIDGRRERELLAAPHNRWTSIKPITQPLEPVLDAGESVLDAAQRRRIRGLAPRRR